MRALILLLTTLSLVADEGILSGSSDHKNVISEIRGPTRETRPLIRAHAHNDYEHPRPLFDALDQGFCSIEADIWLVDGQLLVAHDRKKVNPERTLQALYLSPLQKLIQQNGGGLYPGGPTCTLLIDIKSEA